MTIYGFRSDLHPRNSIPTGFILQQTMKMAPREGRLKLVSIGPD